MGGAFGPCDSHPHQSQAGRSLFDGTVNCEEPSQERFGGGGRIAQVPAGLRRSQPQ
jgi:hypothetical protein